MGTLIAIKPIVSEHFEPISHSLLALVLAFAGGQLSRSLHGTGREPRPGLEARPSEEG